MTTAQTQTQTQPRPSTAAAATAATATTGSYTAVVRYPAPTGDAAERDAAAEHVLDVAAQHEGHLSSVALRGGSPGTPELCLVVSFDSHASWQDWAGSEPARRAIARLEQLTGTTPDGQFVAGMAGWFLLPGLQTPPKWKTVVVSLITLLPVLIAVQALLDPLTASLSPLLGVLVASMVMIPLITYVAMPVMTRVLRGWLYPQAGLALTASTPSVQRGRDSKLRRLSRSSTTPS